MPNDASGSARLVPPSAATQEVLVRISLPHHDATMLCTALFLEPLLLDVALKEVIRKLRVWPVLRHSPSSDLPKEVKGEHGR